MDHEALKAALAAGDSYAAWIDRLAEYFDAHALVFGHGTDNADDEAYWLMLHLLQWREVPLATVPDPALLEPMLALARRRVEQRIPMGYLLGEAWFAGLRFKVDPRVLIPRSPLAEIIEARFEPWITLEPGDRILDIGTGSGCIAIAAAVYCPHCRVDATDVSADALAVAAENVASHGLEGRVRLHESDLFPGAGPRYRVIISNPPYVPAAEVEALPAEYGHEPGLALAGGPSGLDPTHRILAAAGERLEPNGVLVVEVGNEADALAAAYPRVPFTWIEFERGGSGVFVVAAEGLRSGLL
jgi:ribosomal protein L3 glutamine methyltransferase